MPFCLSSVLSPAQLPPPSVLNFPPRTSRASDNSISKISLFLPPSPKTFPAPRLLLSVINAPAHPNLIAATAPLLGTAPSHADLLAGWAELAGDLHAFVSKFNLSGAQLLAFIEDKDTRARLDNYESFAASAAAHRYKTIASEALVKVITSTQDPVEARRAATVLARLARWFHDVALPHATPKASPKTASSKDTPPPDPQPVTNPDPDRAENPGRVVAGLLRRFQHPRIHGPLRAVTFLAAQLAPGATLDHQPIPAQAIQSPDHFLDLAQNSTLSDLSAVGWAQYRFVTNTPSQAALDMYNVRDPDMTTVAHMTLTRADPSSPWLVTSITSPNRPAPPPPRSGGGVASLRSDGGGASDGPAPP